MKRPKRGRPRHDGERRHPVSVAFSRDEIAQLKAYAKRHHQSVSSIVRRGVQSTMEADALSQQIQTIPEAKEILRVGIEAMAAIRNGGKF